MHIQYVRISKNVTRYAKKGASFGELNAYICTEVLDNVYTYVFFSYIHIYIHGYNERELHPNTFMQVSENVDSFIAKCVHTHVFL